MARQAPLIEAYNLMMQNFSSSSSGYLDIVFPDNFAGAYIDYDTLVIQLTDTSPETIAFYRNIIGNNFQITFKEMAFSRNQLMEFGMMFVDSITAPVISFGYDTMNNSFSIALYENSSDSVRMVESFGYMRSLISIPITMELTEAFEFASIMHPGTDIRHRPGSSFSIAVFGTILQGPHAGSLGILTTGHGLHRVTPNTRIYNTGDGRHIGYMYQYRFGSMWGGVIQPRTIYGDWGIVRLTAGFRLGVGGNLTNTIPVSNHTLVVACQINHTYRTPIGTEIFGTGARTVIWQGRITEVDRFKMDNHMFPGVQVAGLARYTLIGNSRPITGDSGGAIWSELDWMTSNWSIFHGVHVGHHSGSFYFSPAILARDYFRPILGFSH